MADLTNSKCIFVNNMLVFLAVIILVFDLTNIKSLHNTK